MRALALSTLALTAITASAQDVRVIPGPSSVEPPVPLEGCVAPLSPAARAAHEADARDYADDGPAPVPMPNWCAETAPLASLPGPASLPGVLRVRPPTYRFDGGAPSADREFYLDRLRQRYERFEALPTPDLPFHGGLGLAPVAPPDDRP